jgi:hypothetical protein
VHSKLTRPVDANQFALADLSEARGIDFNSLFLPTQQHVRQSSSGCLAIFCASNTQAIPCFFKNPADGESCGNVFALLSNASAPKLIAPPVRMAHEHRAYAAVFTVGNTAPPLQSH